MDGRAGLQKVAVASYTCVLHLRPTRNATIRTPMPYTLGEAAKATGKDRATISRAIKNGRISAEKDELGQWAIEPVELHRVYPPLQQHNSARNSDDATERNTDSEAEIRELRAKLEAADERDRLKDEMIEDLKTDRDHWRQQATALLTDQRPARRRGWWPFRRSKTSP